MTGSRTIYQRVESRSIADWKRELASVQSQGNLLEESKICNSIAKLYESGGRLANALKYHMADEDICKLLQDVNGLAIARGNIGGIYLKMRDYEKAAESRLVHLNLATEAESHLEMQRASSELGKVYLEWSEADRISKEEYLTLALKYFQDAYHAIPTIQTKELHKDNEKSGCRLTADALLCEAYTNFGNLYDAQEKREEAIDFHTRALNLAISIGMESMKTVSLVNLGILAVHRKDYGLGLQYFTECLQECDKEKNVEGQAEAMSYLGWAYAQASNYSMALECYSTVYHNVRATFNDAELLQSTSDKIQSVSACLQKVNAMPHLLQLYEHAKSPAEQLEALSNLSEAYRFLEDHEHEVEYNKLAIELITRDEKWIHSKVDELECYYYDTAMALKRLGRSNEAAQYHRKELELISPERGSDKAVTLHCLAVALDQAGEHATSVQQVYQMAYQQALLATPDDSDLQIDILLDLKALYHRVGDLEAYQVVKSQLSELQHKLTEHPSREDQIEIEDDFNYFANRKPSKSLKSFIPGFNMKQKTKKSVGLDLRVRNQSGKRAKSSVSKEHSTAHTASSIVSASQGKKRTLIRPKQSEKENRSNVTDRLDKEKKANMEKEAMFIVDDDSDDDFQSHGVEKPKPKRTFISDEDEPELRPSMHRSSQGARSRLEQEEPSRDSERGRAMLQGRREPFQPEPIDSARDPLLPVSLAKQASGHRSKPASMPSTCSIGKKGERVRISLTAQELEGGFDDDTTMRLDDCSVVNRAPSVEATQSVILPSVSSLGISKQSKKSFSEIYYEACRFAVPPIQTPSKSLVARLASNQTHLQLDSLGLGLAGSMEMIVLLKSLTRMTHDYEIEYVDLSDNHLDDSFLIEWSKLGPDMSHMITLNVARNFFTQRGLESLLCHDGRIRWSSLRNLDCSWNNLNESSLLLASLFRMRLENLFLSHNPMMVISELPCNFVNDTIVRLSVGSNRQLHLGTLLPYIGTQCRMLELSALFFPDADERVTQELLKYHQLERLCLASSTGLSLDTLSRLIQNNRQSLRHLDLCFSSYSISTLKLFTLTSLSTLLLDGTRMNVSDLVHLVESSSSDTLHEIGLAHCGLSHRDLMRLFSAATTKFFRVMNFSFNANAFSTVEDVDQLLRLLPLFTDLKKLVLSGCFSYEASCYLKHLKTELLQSDAVPRLSGGFILDQWEDYVIFCKPSVI